MKNPLRNAFFVAFLVLLFGFATVVLGSRYVVGLFTGSGTTAWLVIVGVLLVILVLMRFRKTKLLTQHEVHDKLLRIVEPQELRDDRLKRTGKWEEPPSQ